LGAESLSAWRWRKEALGVKGERLGIGADPTFTAGGEQIGDDADREANDSGGEGGDHVAREGGEITLGEPLESVGHRDQSAHEAEGRTDAHSEAETSKRTPATAFGGLEDFLQLKFEFRCGGLTGGRVKIEAIAIKREAAAAAAIPGLASKGAKRDEHGRNEAEQASEDGPDQDAGQGVKDVPEVIERSHGKNQ